MTTSSSALSVQDLCVSLYTARGIVPVVSGVSLTLRRGEKAAIVGESGSGKSMTARTIMGLLPRHTKKTVSGHVWLNGMDLLQKSADELSQIRGSQVAMVFQDPLTYLNPRMSIGAQISEAIWLHAPGANLHAETAKALDRVGLRTDRQFMRSYPHELSGGMRQRVLIAIALARNPQILIADEPTTALDVTLQAQILELLNDLCKEMGLALLLITHDLGVVAEICDYVHVMKDGSILESDYTANVFSSPKHPYTKMLLDSAIFFDE